MQIQAAPGSGEKTDLGIYQRAAELAYQYAKKKASGEDTQQTKTDTDQEEEA